jgi:hypothetical protein
MVGSVPFGNHWGWRDHHATPLSTTPARFAPAPASTTISGGAAEPLADWSARLASAIRRICDTRVGQPPPSPDIIELLKKRKLEPPKVYFGADDLVVFHNWLLDLLRHCENLFLTGPAANSVRARVIPDALGGKALDFYNNSVDGLYAPANVLFEDALIAVAMQCISRGAVIRAMTSFEQVAYNSDIGNNPDIGIVQYMTELDNLSNHMICVPDEYTILKRVVNTLPNDMREHLIKICHLSPILSSVTMGATDRNS